MPRQLDAPTAAEVQRAGETLAAVARIDSLRDGFVVFEAEGLAGGRWHRGEKWEAGPHEGVGVPVPHEEGAGLELQARRFVEAAIEVRQRELEEAVSRLTSRGEGTDQADAEDLADLMYV